MQNLLREFETAQQLSQTTWLEKCRTFLRGASENYRTSLMRLLSQSGTQDPPDEIVMGKNAEKMLNAFCARLHITQQKIAAFFQDLTDEYRKVKQQLCVELQLNREDSRYALVNRYANLHLNVHARVAALYTHLSQLVQTKAVESSGTSPKIMKSAQPLSRPPDTPSTPIDPDEGNHQQTKEDLEFTPTIDANPKAAGIGVTSTPEIPIFESPPPLPASTLKKTAPSSPQRMKKPATSLPQTDESAARQAAVQARRGVTKTPVAQPPHETPEAPLVGPGDDDFEVDASVIETRAATDQPTSEPDWAAMGIEPITPVSTRKKEIPKS